MKIRRCYISRCYPHQLAGGYKAKTDIEKIMKQNKFYNLGLPQKINSSNIYIFFYNLFSYTMAVFSIKKNDIIVLQYPLKKYFYIITFIAKIKKANTVILIHDLACFRRKRLSVSEEKKRLSHTNHLIALSNKMKEFIINNGYKQTVSVLHLWDYLNNTKPHKRKAPELKNIQILFAGNFNKNQNDFIYKLINTKNELYIEVYGANLTKDNVINQKQLAYKGVQDSSLIIQDTIAHYGLLWYGSELSHITGPYAEYIKYNTSHTISLYIHAHLPIIVWSKASFAEFTKKHKIGICVDSLNDLEDVLKNISQREYIEMVKNTKEFSRKINQGHYFLEAYFKGENEILKHQN